MRLILLIILFYIARPIAIAQKNSSDSLKRVLVTYPAADSSRVLTLNAYCYSLFFTEPEKIMQYAEEAMAISIKIKWQTGIAQSFLSKGLGAVYGQNNQVAGMDYYQKAIDANRNGFNKLIDAKALSGIGTIFYNQKQYDKALSYWQKSYQVLIFNRLKENEEVLLMNFGKVYYDKKKHDSAKIYFGKSLTLAEAKGNYSIQANVLNSLSLIYLNEGRYDTANQLSLRSLLLSEITGNTLNKANTLVNISMAKQGLNQIDSSIKYGKRALEEAEKAGSMQFRRQAYEALAGGYYNKKMYKEAFNAALNYSILNDSLLSDQNKQDVVRTEMRFEQAQKEAIQLAEINRQKTIKQAVIIGGSILIVSALAIFFFYKKRRDALQKQQEAELKTEVADTEMKALRAQMNPHFIFNSLNSISDYITKNDTQSADRYLSKFAKLMRMILENSEQKDLPLVQDLKALELYMQLEALRMNHKFTYEIIVDENVDGEATMVPPLILQPFVENSIWHGIAKKDGPGKILIHIKKEGDNMINCIVEDDGIGRQQSAFIKTTLPQQHNTSLGMKITQARIDILNKLKNSNAVVKLSDLTQGLRVEVVLPYTTNF